MYGSGFDVVIHYTLDNYVTIQGMVNNKMVNRSGYLLSDVSAGTNSATYNGITVGAENLLTQNLILSEGDGKKKEYPYYQKNDTKYYKDEENKVAFTLLNGKKIIQPKAIYDNFPSQDNNAVQYYQKAAELKEAITSGELSVLRNLTASNAVDETGKSIAFFANDHNPIFDFARSDDVKIEETNSNFNQHRLAIIKYSIENNLKVAIANFNGVSSSTNNFQMPALSDVEWEKIVNNVSIISFLQGLPIGGKIYNGYSVIGNNKTKEVVPLESIYIQTTDDNTYHKITDRRLLEKSNIASKGIGRFNMDFERRSVMLEKDGSTHYFLPVDSLACYHCVIYQNEANTTEDIYQYVRKEVKNNNRDLAKIYYTALGRERQKIYRATT